MKAIPFLKAQPFERSACGFGGLTHPGKRL
jgi:hypothetical protein